MKWLSPSPSIRDTHRGPTLRPQSDDKRKPKARFHVFYDSDETAVKSWVRYLARGKPLLLSPGQRSELQFRLHRARLRGKFSRIFDGELLLLNDEQRENVNKMHASGDTWIILFGLEEM